GSIWNNHQSPSVQNDPPILHHRRSIPGTSDYGGGGGGNGGGGMWDSFNAHRQQNTSSQYLSMMSGLPNERDRLVKQRRFFLLQTINQLDIYQKLRNLFI